MLAVIGALVVTGLLVLSTFWYMGMWYMTIGLAGWDAVKRDLLRPSWLSIGVFIACGWVWWFFKVASNISISVSTG
jgi:hypothetical protein